MQGVAYVGAGNSTSKKDAEKNAARDFVNFLVRTGRIEANEVPANAIEQGGALPARVITENVSVFEVRTTFCAKKRKFVDFLLFDI